ncbi:hypothetical protein L3Q82_013103 [Scortum barcoo]|uniref:Uncharacterized protein n=1 Tax=Scortum barcoo TaxID=214431 RepID=A0ACB8VZ71_9TELE|nr:hypothetical protein L3Q82_013103 [Scortum barcoo]
MSFLLRVAGAPLEIGEVFQACPTGREEAPGRPRTRWRDCLSAGLGTPRSPPRKSWRKCLWGEGSLGISAQTAASVQPGPR